MRKVFFTTIGLMALSITSCTKDKTTNCKEQVSFSTQIMPMIQNNCVSCHDVGATSPTLTTHAEISANATSILNTLNGTPVLMPQGGPALSDTLIERFSCWIDQGKLNN